VVKSGAYEQSRNGFIEIHLHDGLKLLPEESKTAEQHGGAERTGIQLLSSDGASSLCGAAGYQDMSCFDVKCNVKAKVKTYKAMQRQTLISQA
jgi:hypothetical protein